MSVDVQTSAADRVLTNPKTLNQLVCSGPCRLDTCAGQELRQAKTAGTQEASRDCPAAVSGMPSNPRDASCVSAICGFPRSTASNRYYSLHTLDLLRTRLIYYKLTTGLSTALACELDRIQTEVA